MCLSHIIRPAVWWCGVVQGGLRQTVLLLPFIPIDFV